MEIPKPHVTDFEISYKCTKICIAQFMYLQTKLHRATNLVQLFSYEIYASGDAVSNSISCSENYTKELNFKNALRE